MGLPRHLVVGAGEVGSALTRVLRSATTFDTSIRDVEKTSERADVLHICFPFSDTFVESVRQAEEHHHSRLVIVHSTVPMGTCDPFGWVHSPVTGKHPDLERSLRMFTKHVGGTRSVEAARSFRRAGITPRTHSRAKEVEAGKLWELVQFGLQVRITQEIHEWCARHGLDADVVYRVFAESYNQGYQRVGLDKFVRPVLDHVPGPIGGHCVTQCSGFLDHELSRIVREGFGSDGRKYGEAPDG